MFNEGTNAPEFTLKDSTGKEHNLSDYRGRKVVLYFYPKDETPGCTKEACAFRDQYSAIKEKAVLIGISPDSKESHMKFKVKYDLPFILLADVDKEVSDAYDVLVEKQMFGNKYKGVQRSTYIINEKGIIEKTFEKVKPETHAQEILERL